MKQTVIQNWPPRPHQLIQSIFVSGLTVELKIKWALMALELKLKHQPLHPLYNFPI
jgi:hypothetical protein